MAATENRCKDVNTCILNSKIINRTDKLHNSNTKWSDHPFLILSKVIFKNDTNEQLPCIKQYVLG